MASQSFLQGFLSASGAQQYFAAGATQLAIYVNIDTDDKNENTYEIVVIGKDSQNNNVGTPTVPCPTPCPIGPGHQP